MALLSAAALLWRYGGVALAVGRTTLDIVKQESRGRDFKEWVSASGKYASDIAVNALPIPHQLAWYGVKQALTYVFPDQEITSALVSQSYTRLYDKIDSSLKKVGIDLGKFSEKTAATADAPLKDKEEPVSTENSEKKFSGKFQDAAQLSALLKDMTSLFNGDRLALEFIDLKKLDQDLFDPKRVPLSHDEIAQAQSDEKLSRAVRSYLMKRYPDRDIHDERVAFAMSWYRQEMTEQMSQMMEATVAKVQKGTEFVSDSATQFASVAKQGLSFLRKKIKTDHTPK